MSVSRIAVRAGYRLHLGFYRYVDAGVAYGSVGIALEEPYFELHYSTTSYDRKLDIRAPTEEARDAITRVAGSIGLTSGVFELTGYVRHHVGLGSLTRIYLAAAIASALALRRSNLNLEELLVKLGRCRYSCVGYYTLIYGGLVVDSGLKTISNEIPKPLVLSRFPRSWFVVLAIPEGRGLKESEEVKYMDSPTPVEEQKELYRALVELITGVKLEIVDMFTRGVETLQKVAGRYFSQAQGGFFSSPYGDLVARAMAESGLRGIGQSSWGPAIYGFTDSYVAAEVARKAVLSSLSRVGVSCDVWVSKVSEVGYTLYAPTSLDSSYTHNLV